MRNCIKMVTAFGKLRTTELDGSERMHLAYETEGKGSALRSEVCCHVVGTSSALVGPDVYVMS